MKKKIYKYPFNITREFDIIMPLGANIIHVGLDPTKATCMWAEVDPDEQRNTIREFALVGTGHDFPDNIGAHVKTFNQDEFVWHIYHRKQF